MLKVKRTKAKGKKAPKAKKTLIKPASSTVQHYQASHYQNKQIHTHGYFNPFAHNTGIATSSSQVIPHYTSSGGIPYTSTFERHTKKDTVDYVDLVAPETKGNKENQPDYVSVVPMKQTMKEKLIKRAEYRKKNDIPESVKVSPLIRDEKIKEKEKLKEFVKDAKRSAEQKKRLRGTKNNEEL